MRRFIKPNHRTCAPSHHVVVDTETVPVPDGQAPHVSTHILVCGSARSWRYESGIATRLDSCEFTQGEEFWAWLSRHMAKDRPLTLWSHNAGFDLAALRFWDRIACGEFSLTHPWKKRKVTVDGVATEVPVVGQAVTADPPTVIKVWDRRGAQLTCLDSCNWVCEKLGEIGAALDLPKLPMPGELASISEWQTYCNRDAEILEKLVHSIVDFVQKNDLGNLRYTAASQSMAWWRHGHGKEQIVTVDDELVKKREREAYYGGTKEVWFQGWCLPSELEGMSGLAVGSNRMPVLWKGPTYHLDLASAYPSVMRDNVFPVSYLRTISNVEPSVLCGKLSALGGVARCWVETQIAPYPVRRPDATVWCTGSFETVLCGPELLRALEENHVKRVVWAQLYALGHPFEQWAKAALSMRRLFRISGKPLWERLAKLLANSLHGKFAQHGHRWETVPGDAPPQQWGVYQHYCKRRKCTVTRRAIGNSCQELLGDTEPPGSFPLIAAYTTAYVREIMRKARQVARPRNTLYTYVDSMHVTKDGYDLMCEKGLVGLDVPGMFRLDGSTDKACYHAPNYYQWGEHIVIPGVSTKAVQDAKGLWHQDNFLHIDSLIGDHPPIGPVSSDRVTPTPDAIIRGRVSPSGWVDPLHVPGYNARDNPGVLPGHFSPDPKG